MSVRAWYMDDDTVSDQRLEHKLNPNRECSPETLLSLGVKYWHLNADIYETDEVLARIRQEEGYNYTEIVTLSPDKLENYAAKLIMFFTEHLHTDDEIRYCLSGSGYFDMRDFDDHWIRIAVEKGDMIVLPAGSYHRFTLDSTNFIQAMRLFKGLPIWTPLNRPQDDLQVRRDYLQKYRI